MRENLFRKVSIERLSSPEQLDQLMTITGSRAWIGLAGMFCLLLVLLIWSLFGVLETKIEGSGVIIRGGGVYELNAVEQGVITDIKVEAGDLVQKGEVMAYISSPELVRQMQQLQLLLKEAQNEADIEELNDIDEQLKVLQSHTRNQAVVSQYDGQILQVNVNQGGFVRPGDTLLEMESGKEQDSSPQALIFLPVEQSRKVSPGMTVELNPDGVSFEEYGFLMGKVLAVSQYPLSSQEMQRLFGNEEIVKQFCAQEALYAVKVEFIPDAGDPFAYQWSLGSNPEFELRSRDLCKAAIIDNYTRPINLLLPW